METKHIHISDYNYDLPDSRIAKFPVSPRDTSKLLVYRHGEISDDIFYNLPKYLPQKSLMVFNNTKVIQARMHFRKETGALIEVFLMEPAAPTDYELMFQTRGECSWLCMVGNLKKWKEGSLVRTFDVAGSTINFEATMRRDIIDTKSGGTNYWVDFAWDNPQVSFAEILDAVGELPIPPYLNRETQDSDKTTYQTVYSKIKGSVAAPTAGLHFTDKVLAAIDAAGVRREELTLHVGAGTFKPVKSEEIDGHTMHTEYVCVRRDTLQTLLDYDCCAIAVGTTSVRTLESLYYMGVKLEANPDAAEEDLHVCQWEPYEKADGTLDAVGELPIPPYLNRETQDSDKTTYQTVYSKIKGSVAAPTAGLHFTDKVLAAIDAAGVRREELTLHVGAGTFKPVKSEEIDGHTMHTEYVCVRRDTLQTLLDYDCCAIAVGTTSVRTLESLYYMGVKLEANPDAAEEDLHVCQWEPYEKADGTPVDGNLIDGITPQKAISNIIAWLDKNNLKTLHSSTQIIIAPGYEYKIVKVLVTNFHQPQSTLLLLVSAFLKGDWRNVYDYALSHDFRFLSYGDSSILIP